MTHPRLARVLLCAALIGCSSEEVIGPDGEIDYQGEWTGNIGDPNTVQRITVTWTPTHTRNTVTGPIVFRLTSTLTARGTLAANVVGEILELTLTVPPGAYPSPISQACTLTGTGTSSVATDHDIVALLALTYTAPCLGTLTNNISVNHRLTLIKVE